MGREIFSAEESQSIYPILEFLDNYTWFNKAVARWLDIALYKAMQRIIKAVEIDDLEPVDELVKHSSSAVDIRTVLMQIKTFWKQLSWPDVEASYAFISKILDVSAFIVTVNSLHDKVILFGFKQEMFELEGETQCKFNFETRSSSP